VTDLEELLEEARRVGLTISSYNGHPVVSGPIGTEQLAVRLVEALEAATPGTNGSIDEPYVWGAHPTFSQSFPFTRAEYAALVQQHQRYMEQEHAQDDESPP
jgi:hypothetical protein